MRVTTSSHPLAKLRAITGWSREECAKVCGMTAANVQNVELGRTPLTREAAIRLQSATGCDANSLLSAKSTPLAPGGAKFTRRIYEQWNLVELDPLSTRLTIRRYQSMVEDLLRGASGEPGRFRRLCNLLSHALEQLPAEAGLSLETINASARARGKMSVRSAHFHRLQEVFGEDPRFVEAIRDKDISKWKNKACPVTLRDYSLYPSRDPHLGKLLSPTWILREEWDIVFPDGSSVNLPFDSHSVKYIEIDSAGHVIDVSDMSEDFACVQRRKRVFAVKNKDGTLSSFAPRHVKDGPEEE